MKVTPTDLPGVLLVEPAVFRDVRGHFTESWNQARYREAGIPAQFVQDNLSVSGPGVLRGLHYQEPHAQAKLVSVLRGEVWDVALDIRVGSPTFGRWTAHTLSADNARQLFIPEGFAHGFVATSAEPAIFLYKCTEYYHPASEGILRWDDPDLGIPWPVEAPSLSGKDRMGLRLRDVPPERLPRFHGG